jgi:hypothetical protein
MTYDQRITYHGFSFEEHKVKTEDGYILSIWRIFKKERRTQGKVVIVNHGLLDSSYTFLAHGENESLPFILANDG